MGQQMLGVKGYTLNKISFREICMIILESYVISLLCHQTHELLKFAVNVEATQGQKWQLDER